MKVPFGSYSHVWVKSRQLGRCALAGFSVVMLVSMYGCLGGSGGGSSSATAPVDKYANVPTPTVKQLPIGTIGSSGHDYPWFSPDFSLNPLGYVQEEFTIEGTANQYDMPAPAGGVGNGSGATPTGTVVSKDNPYRTRIHVIRPIEAAKFNGTVIVEWQNATSGYDTPVHWLQQKDMIIRKGYAWVGISAQRNSIANATTGLKAWSPNRYGTLDVTHGGKFMADELSYDIFAQGAKAIRTLPVVMGGLSVKRLIAVGASQSAGRLGFYLNSVEPLTKIYDAALLSVGGPTMRTDLSLPIIKVLSETELAVASTNEIPRLQADTNNFRIWMMPGASHADNYGLAARSVALLRDANIVMGDSCDYPSRSRYPYRYVYNSAIVKLEQYLDKGTPLPQANPMVILTANPPTVGRDAYGNALGGVRMPENDAPIAMFQGGNSGAGMCFLNGTHVQFSKGTLDTLYPTHTAYVQKYTAAVQAAVSAGFMLEDDASEAIASAESSIIGKQLNCDGVLCKDESQFTKQPSIGTMRWFAFVYGIPDRAKLLAPIDAATGYIATGYLYSDPVVARPYFTQAVSSLNTYIAEVQAQLQKQTISQKTADFLVGQANTLITELGKL